MELKEYFEKTKGVGVFSTADGDGRVDSAVYSRPNFLEDGCLAMIMRDRLTHKNLLSNPYAVYLYIEDGPGYKGKRLFLKKLGEGQSRELVESMHRHKDFDHDEETRFLVFFELEKVLPLVGV